MNNLWRYFTIAMAVLVLNCTVYAETIQKAEGKARHGKPRYPQGGGRRINLELQYLEARLFTTDSAQQANRERGVLASAEDHFPHRYDAQQKEHRVAPPDAGIHFSGSLVGVYWDLGDCIKLGAGYKFSPLADDLPELALDRGGPFISLIGSL